MLCVLLGLQNISWWHSWVGVEPGQLPVKTLKTSPGVNISVVILYFRHFHYTFHSVASLMTTWKCITLATVDYRGSIVVSERSETALPLNILAVFFLWILVKQSIQADQQIFSTCAKHLASKNGGPPWVLFYAHSPWLPFHQLPRGLLRSRILFYHACLLIDNNNVHVSRSELPRLPRKTVDRRTDTHTHTHCN